MSYDHYESFTFLSYFCKTSILKKKLAFYLHFEKKSNLALKSGYPYDRMQSFCKKIIKHGKNGQNSYFS